MDVQQFVEIMKYVAPLLIVYGGIRADIKTMHEGIGRVERNAEKAHERLDDHITNYHKG